MLTIIITIVLISMVLILVRGFKGPTAYDRILAANSFGSYTVIMIILLTFVLDNTSFLDIALIYALINFIATIAFLRYFRIKSFGK